MYDFFCKPLRYSFVIMRTLQKNTHILAKTKYFHAYTHNNLHTFMLYECNLSCLYHEKHPFFCLAMLDRISNFVHKRTKQC